MAEEKFAGEGKIEAEGGRDRQEWFNHHVWETRGADPDDTGGPLGIAEKKKKIAGGDVTREGRTYAKRKWGGPGPGLGKGVLKGRTFGKNTVS